MTDMAKTGGAGVTAPVVLPARLDSAAAIQLARDLRPREGADVTIDASGVDLMGAKAVQTLVVAAAAWRAGGHAFSVTGLPAKARDQLAILGLSDFGLLDGAVS
jgi:anti-anti-sigma regulatory factor